MEVGTATGTELSPEISFMSGIDTASRKREQGPLV